MAVAVTRTDLSVEQLRAEARRATTARQELRILAIALVLEGHGRREALQTCGMDRQTLRDWVHRYNEAGIEGLADRPRSGRPACLSKAERAEVETWVEQGADLATDGVVRFRRCDLRDRIAGRFGVYLQERSVGQLLRDLNFRRLSVRPLHPKTDPVAQETFKTNFADLVREALPADAAGKPMEIWFQDEARVGQQGTLTRIWARLTKGSVERSSMEWSDEGKRGTRPRALKDRRFNWTYLFGAICPARGAGNAVVMPRVNVEAMNHHLAAISTAVSDGAIAVLVADRAGWHRSRKLIVPDNIVLLPLPPYAPELNPVENIWEYLRGNQLAHTVWDTYSAIEEACCNAWNGLMRLPDVIRSIGKRHWATVKT